MALLPTKITPRGKSLPCSFGWHIPCCISPPFAAPGTPGKGPGNCVGARAPRVPIPPRRGPDPPAPLATWREEKTRVLLDPPPPPPLSLMAPASSEATSASRKALDFPQPPLPLSPPRGPPQWLCRRPPPVPLRASLFPSGPLSPLPRSPQPSPLPSGPSHSLRPPFPTPFPSGPLSLPRSPQPRRGRGAPCRRRG